MNEEAVNRRRERGEGGGGGRRSAVARTAGILDINVVQDDDSARGERIAVALGEEDEGQEGTVAEHQWRS